MTTPTDAEDSRSDMARLLDELAAEVERRREAGEYPPGLEHELDAYFRQQVPERFDTVALAERLRAFDAAADVGPHRMSTESAVPLGAAVHSAVARLVRRQTDGVLAQLRDLAGALQGLLHLMVERLPDEDVRHTSARVDLLLDRIAAYERVPFDGDGAARALAVRVAALEAAVREITTPPWFDGDVDTGAIGDDADAVRSLRDSLDVRGEVLSVSARNRAAVDAIEARPDESLDAVLVTDGVARMSPRRLGDVVAAATVKLRDGGRLVIRASEGPTASADAWLPGVPLDTVRTMVSQAGFASVDVLDGAAPRGTYTVVATK
jgi:hypothetical protein